VRFAAWPRCRRSILKIARGEIRAIIGPNGAGKSTFFQLPDRRIGSDRCRILFNGDEIYRPAVEQDIATGNCALLSDHQYFAERHRAGKRAASPRNRADPRLEYGLTP